MSGPPSTSSDRDLLDQTVYLARRIYDDPQIPPVSLDLHSACAIGNYDCVQDAINSDKNLNARNKGIHVSECVCVCLFVCGYY